MEKCTILLVRAKPQKNERLKNTIPSAPASANSQNSHLENTVIVENPHLLSTFRLRANSYVVLEPETVKAKGLMPAKPVFTG